MSEQSLSGTALALLRERGPEESVDLGSLAEALGFGPADDAEARNRASMLVSTALARPTKTSPWRHVHRIGRGDYVYDEALTADETGWQMVARDDSDAVVLRSPDGRLYVARPLGT